MNGILDPWSCYQDLVSVSRCWEQQSLRRTHKHTVPALSIRTQNTNTQYKNTNIQIQTHKHTVPALSIKNTNTQKHNIRTHTYKYKHTNIQCKH